MKQVTLQLVDREQIGVRSASRVKARLAAPQRTEYAFASDMASCCSATQHRIHSIEPGKGNVVERAFRF